MYILASGLFLKYDKCILKDRNVCCVEGLLAHFIHIFLFVQTNVMVIIFVHKNPLLKTGFWTSMSIEFVWADREF